MLWMFVLLTNVGKIFDELGDGGRVLLDPGHLPLLDQNLQICKKSSTYIAVNSTDMSPSFILTWVGYTRTCIGH